MFFSFFNSSNNQTSEPTTFSDYADLDKIFANSGGKEAFYEFQSHLATINTQKQIDKVLSKPDLFTSKNSKQLARDGIPLSHLKSYLLKMFNVKDTNNYDMKANVVMKGFSVSDLDEFVPTFSNNLNFKEFFDQHYLNAAGQLALKEVLWLLNSDFSKIQFSPMIVHFCALTLLFLSKEETFLSVRSLINRSRCEENDSLIRWHFKFTIKDNQQLLAAVLETVKTFDSSSLDKMSSGQGEQAILDTVFVFFINNLTFPQLYCLYQVFLTEGIKALFRLSICLFSNGNTIKALKVKTPDKLKNEMFGYKLTRNNHKFGKVTELTEAKGSRNEFYLPELENKIATLSRKEIMAIWPRLPGKCRIYNLESVYLASEDGYGLENVIEKFKNCTASLYFFVVYLEDLTIVIFSSQKIELTDGFERPEEFSLFVIDQVVTEYKCDEVEKQILLVDKEQILIGCKDNSTTVRIDEKLNWFTIDNDNMFNLKLPSEKMKIGNLEVIAFL